MSTHLSSKFTFQSWFVPIMAANGDYRRSLNTKDLQTYLTKLEILGGNVDPYGIPSSDFSKDVSVWPEITYPDLVNYLVFSPNPPCLQHGTDASVQRTPSSQPIHLWMGQGRGRCLRQHCSHYRKSESKVFILKLAVISDSLVEGNQTIENHS